MRFVIYNFFITQFLTIGISIKKTFIFEREMERFITVVAHRSISRGQGVRLRLGSNNNLRARAFIVLPCCVTLSPTLRYDHLTCAPRRRGRYFILRLESER